MYQSYYIIIPFLSCVSVCQSLCVNLQTFKLWIDKALIELALTSFESVHNSIQLQSDVGILTKKQKNKQTKHIKFK